MRKAYVFPGQGSQVKGMGRELFDRYPRVVDEASAVLGYSLRELCLDDPVQKLNLTQYTQPALFAVSYLYWLRKVEVDGPPDVMAGHSLGEYVALCCAGAFDFQTGLRLVARRGSLMGSASGGGMIAVIGMTPAQLRRALRNPEMAGLDVANFNSYEQTVLAGPAEEIGRAIPLLESAGARHVIPLKVSAPFHSRYMRSIEPAFSDALRSCTFRSPDVPVVSNFTAEPYDDGAITHNLVQQISNPVRWVESVEQMVRMGCSAIEEVGPGNVLTRLIDQVRVRSAFAS